MTNTVTSVSQTSLRFFISYNKADQEWAEWIAWQLEAAGHRVTFQGWDFQPGANFVLEMQRAVAEADRTVLVLSPDYLQAKFTQPEWAAAFARDPKGENRGLLPVRVRDCQPEAILGKIVYVDLVGVEKREVAVSSLFAGLKQRNKPSEEPRFPGIGSEPRYPGSERPSRTDTHQVLSDASARNLLNQLQSKLDGIGVELGILVDGLGQIDSDLAVVARSAKSIFWCVDYRDLHRYLELPAPQEGEISSRQLISDVALVSLFAKLNPPAILLPSYYLEFREFISKKFRDRRAAEVASDSIRVIFRSRVAGCVERLDHALNQLGNEEGRLASSRLEESLSALVGSFQEELAAIQDMMRAASMVRRFEALVESDGIRSLSQVLGEDFVLEIDDPVYQVAKSTLDAFRKGRPAANIRDAKAIGTVSQLNRRGDDLYLLVSSVPSMRRAVQRIRRVDGVADWSGSVKLRDETYWQLRFGLESQVVGEPDPLSIRSYASGITHELRPLREKVMVLRRSVEWASVGAETGGKMDTGSVASLLKETNQLVDEIDVLTQSATSSLASDEARLGLIEDTLSPFVSQQNEAFESLRQLQSMLPSMRRQRSLDGWKREIRRLRTILVELVERFAVLEVSQDRLRALDSLFMGSLTAESPQED